MSLEIPGYRHIRQIYAGERTIVYRAIRLRDQAPVVLKLLRHEYPTFGELVQFRNQFLITQDLELPGVIVPASLEPYRQGHILVMPDVGAIPVMESLPAVTASPQTVQDFLAMAIQLVQAIVGLHAHQIIHKDIKPANVLMHPETRRVYVVDFSIATRLPRETAVVASPNVVEGTLAYLSPEQTGRMNRGVDYRSDFYALGCTFYHLLTRQVPFVHDDPLEVLHCHLAKSAVPVHRLNAYVPCMLSKIVAKLMSKNAEHRYQSGLGLQVDLQHCLESWEANETIPEFELAQHDCSDRFLIPEKLYGREAEVQQLLSAFDRVAVGATELVLVAGHSGIGKTAVVHEVHKPIVRQRGYFIRGKYDQLQRNVPLSAFVQALRALMGQVLSEPKSRLVVWKSEISMALGGAAQVIIDVIPELERVIGPQPAAPELTSAAATDRFQRLLRKFVQVFVDANHPLVIFLDDLQWADIASLQLMQLLLQESKYLLIVGAYRNNEVSRSHPLMLTMDDLRKDMTAVQTITLQLLEPAYIHQIVADTLNCEPIVAEPLGDLVYQRAQGNPFFTGQFLRSLYQDGFIYFERQTASWECNLAAIRTLSLTDNVLEFMTSRLRKLPLATQQVLQLAACIGAEFDLDTLVIIAKQPAKQIAEVVWTALEAGLIVPLNENYKVAQGTIDIAVEAVGYRFLHDRVQQAAYALIPADQRSQTHFKIGQLLYQQLADDELEQRLFDVVNSLNLGQDFVASLNERTELAALNLRAAQKAKAATAYLTAAEYCQYGLLILGNPAWSRHHELTLKLHELGAEAAALGGDFEQASMLIEAVLDMEPSPLAQVQVYRIQIRSLIFQNRLADAVRMGHELLGRLGVQLPQRPSKLRILLNFLRVKLLLKGRSISDLAAMPAVTSKTVQAALSIMSILRSATYLLNPQLYALAVLKELELTLKNGNTPLSAGTYCAYGMILSGVVGDIQGAYDFGELAHELLDNQHPMVHAGVHYVVYSLLRPLKMHRLESSEPLLKSYYQALESGNTEYATWLILGYLRNTITVGQDLQDSLKQHQIYQEALSNLKQQTALRHLSSSYQFALNLCGQAECVSHLNGTALDAETDLPLMITAGDKTATALAYVFQLMLAYWFDDIDRAIATLPGCEKYLSSVSVMPEVQQYWWFAGLTRLAHYPIAADQRSLLKQVDQSVQKLQKWAKFAPMNCCHRVLLLEAERDRVLGRNYAASDAYDAAIAMAKANGYLQEHALANELAAKFYWSQGKDRIAAGYMQDAYYGYAQWGAKSKVKALVEKYPQLLWPILKAGYGLEAFNNSLMTFGAIHQTLLKRSSVSGKFSLSAIFKASQAIDDETELDQLFGKLIEIVVQASGADKATLLLKQEKEVQVVAQYLDEHVKSLQPVPLERSQQLPIPLVQYVVRTKETVLTGAPIVQEAYGEAPEPASVLCMPLLSRGRLVGVLYAENSMISGLFTDACVELLKILCFYSQAAIAVENTQLYHQAERSAQDLEKAFVALQDAQAQIIQGEKMSALGQMVAGITHEINNPVNFIHGNMTYLNDYTRDLLNLIKVYQAEYPQPTAAVQAQLDTVDLEFIVEDLKKVVRSATTGAERIQKIVQSLSNFSHLDETGGKLTDINEALDGTLAILKHRLGTQASGRTIKVIHEYDRQLPLVTCYPAELNQVFWHLVANAIDAFESVERTAKDYDCITITTQLLADNWVQVSIADNGSGIPADIQSKIFDPFFTTKAVGKGTGMGLSVSYQIIQQHQGRLFCQSESGAGTQFIIELPVMPNRVSCTIDGEISSS